MIVKYSTLTYEEVKQTRRKALRPLPGSTREAVLSLLKLSPFVLGWVIMIYLSTKYYVYKLFKFLLTKNLGKFNNVSINIIFTSFLMVLICVSVFSIYTKIYFWFVKEIFPIKTPIADKEKANNQLYDKTGYIEEILKFQVELKQRKVEDIQYSDIYIEGNSLEVLIKDSDHGLTTKHKFSMTDEEKDCLFINTGILDFSYLDNVWADQIIETKMLL